MTFEVIFPFWHTIMRTNIVRINYPDSDNPDLRETAKDLSQR
jgi:hypothetical protein